MSVAASQAFHQSARRQQEVAVQQEEAVEAKDDRVTQFKDLALKGLVHPNIINTITDKMKIETMTDVQSRTINEALSGVDVYVSLSPLFSLRF